MSLKNPKRYLVVLDVGHGSAAVLHDEGGTVVFDTGKGAHVDRHLQQAGVTRVQAVLLSHADSDHIGGAVTLLMNKGIQIDEVFLNPDPTKNSVVFEQLRYALAESNKRSKTRINPSLTTSTNIQRKGAMIEVLHPPAEVALAGVGGKSKTGKHHTSNSLSAAIRVSLCENSSVLLGGDIEFDCLDEWKARKVCPSSAALIFPHHGGMPGTSDESEAELFAHEIARLVKPRVVIFSIHRTRFNNPKNAVLSAVAKASKGVRFLCTQLPEHFRPLVAKEECWSLHQSRKPAEVVEGSICMSLLPNNIDISFGLTP